MAIARRWFITFGRYLIVTLAILGAFIIAFLLVVVGHDVVDRTTCDPELFWSNRCYDSKIRPLLMVYENASVVFVCVAVGLMAMYSSFGLNRMVVIKASYVIGAIILGLTVIPLERYDLLASGLSFGLVLGVYLHRKARTD